MRETDFIGQNKEKWVDFERTLSNKQADPDDLSKLFIEATDDLSFSRTYYPTRSVGEYLNGLAQKVYRSIYNNRKREKGSFSRFWLEEIPDAMWASRKGLLVSFIVFFVGCLIGILSTHHNPDFTSIILSESYVEMTEQNISENNPMAVYQQQNAVSMFIDIAWNNIRVALFCFVLGLLFQVGSLFFILYNSIMFGSFMWFFFQRGLIQESFLAVMLHGTIELSMIIIAGAAGVALGKGLVFPGNYSRLQAMTKSARHASKIIIAVAVFLVLAAFIEGFLTRYSVLENAGGQMLLDVLRAIFILLSGALVLGYFILLPWRRHARGKAKEEGTHETLVFDEELELASNIKSTSEVNNFAWKVFFKALSPIGTANALLAVIISIGLAILLQESTYLSIFDADTLSSGDDGFFDALWLFDNFNDFFQFTKLPILLCFVLPSLALSLFTCTYFTAKKLSIKANKSVHLINALLTSILLLVPFALYWDKPDLEVLYFFYNFLVLFWWIVVLGILAFSAAQGVNLGKGSQSFFKLIGGLWTRLIGTFFLIALVSWLCTFIIGAPLKYFVYEIIKLQLSPGQGWSIKIMFVLHSIIILTSAGILLAPIVIGLMTSYFSILEINTAEGLLSRIKEIKFKRRAYGLETEK